MFGHRLSHFHKLIRNFNHHLGDIITPRFGQPSTACSIRFSLSLQHESHTPGEDLLAPVFMLIRETAPLSKCDLTIPRSLLVIARFRYVSAAAIRVALGPTFPFKHSSPIVLSWPALFGADIERLKQPLDIGEVYLAGAGAVGHGFVYTLRYFDVIGTLYVTDPKAVSAGGLNRCLLFNADDLGYPKATRLCKVSGPLFSKLALVPVDKELDEARKLRSNDFLIEKLVVGVDSRRVRRSQSVLPGTVFDASTTDITEVVLHFNRQPTELACLGCVYPENERERKHEENVAGAGFTVEEVRTSFISPLIALKICKPIRGTSARYLVGRAFDTVYKEVVRRRQAQGSRWTTGLGTLFFCIGSGGCRPRSRVCDPFSDAGRGTL